MEECIALAVKARQKHGSDKVRSILLQLGYRNVIDISGAADLTELKKRLKALL